jgi:hypothetical protein
LNAHPEMTVALLSAPPTGIDPEILNRLLGTSELHDLLVGLLAPGGLNPAGTSAMLQASGNFVGNLLNRNAGGLTPETIVTALHGTGAAPDPQSVLRRTWIFGATEIILGWTLPPIQAYIQVTDARLNTVEGQPLDPW